MKNSNRFSHISMILGVLVFAACEGQGDKNASSDTMNAATAEARLAVSDDFKAPSEASLSLAEMDEVKAPSDMNLAAAGPFSFTPPPSLVIESTTYLLQDENGVSGAKLPNVLMLDNSNYGACPGVSSSPTIVESSALPAILSINNYTYRSSDDSSAGDSLPSSVRINGTKYTTGCTPVP